MELTEKKKQEIIDVLTSIARDLVRVDNATEYVMKQSLEFIAQNAKAIQNEDQFNGWACKVVTDYALAYIRQYPDFYKLNVEDENDINAGYVDYAYEYANQDTEEIIPEYVLSDVEQLKIVKEKLNQLSDVDKIILQYYYVENISVSEIATKLGMDISVVKRSIGKIKNSIKFAVDADGFNKTEKIYSLAAIPFVWIVYETAVKGVIPKSVAGIAASGAVGAKGVAGTGAAKAASSGSTAASASAKAAAKVGTGVMAKLLGSLAGKIAVAAATVALVAGTAVTIMINNKNKGSDCDIEDKEIIYLTRTYNYCDQIDFKEEFTADNYADAYAYNFIENYQGLEDDMFRDSTPHQSLSHHLDNLIPVQFSDELYEINRKMQNVGDEMYFSLKDTACEHYIAFKENNYTVPDANKKDDYVTVCHGCNIKSKANNRGEKKQFYYKQDYTDEFKEANGNNISFKALGVDYEFEIEKVTYMIYVCEMDKTFYDFAYYKDVCVPYYYTFMIEGHYTKGKNEKTLLSDKYPNDISEHKDIIDKIVKAYREDDGETALKYAIEAANEGSKTGVFWLCELLSMNHKENEFFDYADYFVYSDNALILNRTTYNYTYVYVFDDDFKEKYNLKDDPTMKVKTWNYAKQVDYYPIVFSEVSADLSNEYGVKDYSYYIEAYNKGYGRPKNYVYRLEEGY